MLASCETAWRSDLVPEITTSVEGAVGHAREIFSLFSNLKFFFGFIHDVTDEFIYFLCNILLSRLFTVRLGDNKTRRRDTTSLSLFSPRTRETPRTYNFLRYKHLVPY